MISHSNPLTLGPCHAIPRHSLLNTCLSTGKIKFSMHHEYELDLNDFFPEISIPYKLDFVWSHVLSNVPHRNIRVILVIQSQKLYHKKAAKRFDRKLY